MNIMIYFAVDLCYSSLVFFNEKLTEAFGKNGHNTFQIHSVDEAMQLKDKCDFIVGFNMNLMLEIAPGVNFFNKVGLPVVNFLVDHPYLHHMYMDYDLEVDKYLVVLDENHRDYTKKYYPKIKDVCVTYVLSEQAPNTLAIPKERDILFLASYTDEKEYLERLNSKQDWLKAIGLRSLEYLLANPNETVEDAIATIMGEDRHALTDNEFAAVVCAVGVPIDFFLRGYFRNLLVEQLTTAGLKVVLCGSRWEKLKVSKPQNIILQPEVPFHKAPQMLASSKFILNVTPWFKRGIHDRVISTMLNKSVCVSDHTAVTEKLFTDGIDMVTFDLNNMSALPEKMYDVIFDDYRIDEIATNGYNKASGIFSWEKVAKEITDMMSKNLH